MEKGSDERRGGAGIRVGSGAQVRLENVRISNSRIGISAGEGAIIDASGLQFDRVETPFENEGIERAHLEQTRIANDPKIGGGVKSGWRRAQGAALPVHCGQCQAIFPSRNYVFGGAFFTAWDNEEPCPECGNEHAKLSEGIFRLTEEAVEVIYAPDVTHQMLAVLRDQAQSVANGLISTEAAAARLDAVNPKLSSLLRRASRSGVTALTLLASIAGAYYGREAYLVGEKQLAAQQESNRSSDQVTEQLLRAMERVTVTLEGIRQNTNPENRQSPNTNPPIQEADPVPERVEERSAKKTKAKHLRRAEERNRRSQLGRSRHR